jgi:hypothetical protein
VNILITGKGGTAGSWKIRAEQLGAALRANVKPMASVHDCAIADVIVVVKRTPAPLIDAIRHSGKPWVLDIVDGWPQPCDWDESRSKAWLLEHLGALQPSGVIFGTERMAFDAGPFRSRSLVLPHHSWDRYVKTAPAVRDRVQVVGYEGSPDYLGRWRPILEQQCSARGWDLQINGDMRHTDIGIALRDTGGYPARWWKPGTKLSNLHALGIPALCSREAGYDSVKSGAELWIESEADVKAAFDMLADRHVRRALGSTMRQAMILIDEVARDYREWLSEFV